jgi:hypothetical protein
MACTKHVVWSLTPLFVRFDKNGCNNSRRISEQINEGFRIAAVKRKTYVKEHWPLRSFETRWCHSSSMMQQSLPLRWYAF